VLEDMTGMTKQEAEKLLKGQLLTAKCVGDGETVTGQIPAPGDSVPGGSEVLLYLGEEPEETAVEVPDFLGMNRKQASDLAGSLGLYILVRGNDDLSPSVTVTTQNVPAGTKVPVGTTIRLEFADTKVSD